MTETNQAEYWAVYRVILSNEVKRARRDTRALNADPVFPAWAAGESRSMARFMREWNRNSARYWRIVANEWARIERGECEFLFNVQHHPDW